MAVFSKYYGCYNRGTLILLSAECGAGQAARVAGQRLDQRQHQLRLLRGGRQRARGHEAESGGRLQLPRGRAAALGRHREDGGGRAPAARGVRVEPYQGRTMNDVITCFYHRSPLA